ncbi:conserved hypothetical protein [Microbacterium sp. 8M]|jgi:hypothetical protein|uniref:hypothetical protein n=1 Tax=Microbacterium sp. 8M TaxID=2653153 RepID=UPI0012EFAC0B|nr:hypothetical protein [Microbacterium sp. 8M]VXC30393.1 conserved hypothetical protein [Microbacterium sp. 8M]
MSTVTVTGNAWTHAGQPIPAAMHPELWFRPQASALGSDGLLAAVEVQATLAADGSFTVELESDAGIFYRPFMRWVTNPSEQDPQNWAYRYAEWEFLVVPGLGGNISDLINNFPPGTIIVALGPPLSGVTNVAWVDMTDQTEDGALVYAPERN